MRIRSFGLLALGGFVVMGLWVPQIQTQNSQNVPIKPSPTREHDPARFPLVEFTSDKKDDESRKQINSRYEQYVPFTIGIPHPDTSGHGVYDHVKRPDAIPTDADLVIMGQILSGSAHLTNGKRSIYSEFVIRVDEVIKQDQAKEIVVAENIIADRLGGRIRFKNGQEVTYQAMGFDMPAIGKQHVLFLARDNKSPNYKIITGYELIGDEVQPIDRVDTAKIHKDKSAFLKQIKPPTTPTPQL